MTGPEREAAPEQELWNDDVELGEGVFFDEPFALRAQVHTAREQYRGRGDADILELRWPEGIRDYVLIHPYILIPDVSVDVGLYSKPTGGAIGEVVSTDWRGMRHERIGDGQAWYYPKDRALVLWECTLFDRFREDNPLVDHNLHMLWRGFQSFLINRFPQSARVVTPSWEPIYDDQASWRQFLEEQGFSSLSDRAYGKEVAAA